MGGLFQIFWGSGGISRNWTTTHSLQYSCLENPMERGSWRATVQGVAKSRTQVTKHRHPSPFWHLAVSVRTGVLAPGVPLSLCHSERALRLQGQWECTRPPSRAHWVESVYIVSSGHFIIAEVKPCPLPSCFIIACLPGSPVRM